MAGSPDSISLKGVVPMSVKGRRIDPALTNQFVVSLGKLGEDYGLIDKTNLVSFSRISGFGSSIKTAAMRQGTSPIVTYTPENVVYDEITLSRGVASYEKAFAVMRWYRDTTALLFSVDPVAQQERLISQQANSAEATPTTAASRTIRFRPVSIRVPNRGASDQIPFLTTLIDAWPVKASFGNFDANSTQVWIYSLTLKYAGIEFGHELPTSTGPAGAVG